MPDNKTDAPILVTVDVSSIRYDIAGLVREQVKDHVDDHLRKVVAAEVEQIAIATVRDKIKAAAEETFAQGWAKTDEYGRPTGQTRTVRDMILEHLNARDRYSSNGSWLEKTLTELMRETIQKVVQPEIEAAKKAFKEMLDVSIRDKLATALREAMGLK